MEDGLSDFFAFVETSKNGQVMTLFVFGVGKSIAEKGEQCCRKKSYPLEILLNIFYSR
jgi:hypothetical protein